MKINDIITEAPKKSAKKNDKYAPVDFGDIDHMSILIKQGKQIVAFMKKHCKSWLSQTKNGSERVWRGFEKVPAGKIAFTKLARLDRAPKDTSGRRHEIFNRVIHSCGKVANRSNSFFVADENTAMSYGNYYNIIPIGDFNYTWHTNIDDWTGSTIDQTATLKPTDIRFTPDEEKALKTKLGAEYDKKVAALKAKGVNPADQQQDAVQALYDAAVSAGLKTNKQTFIKHIKKASSSILDFGPGHGRYSYMVRRVKKYGSKLKVDTSWYGAHDLTLHFLAYVYSTLPPAKKKAFKQTIKMIAGKIPTKQPLTTKSAYIQHGIENAKLAAFKAQSKSKDKLSIEGIKARICPNLKGDDNTLMQAIKSRNEIMISSEKILAVNPVVYENIVIPLLNGKTPKTFDIYKITSNDGDD